MNVFSMAAALQVLSAASALAGPLHDAAKAGDTSAILAALEAGEQINDSDAMAPALFHAARRGHVDAAALLVDRGADVNAASKMGTPLTAAASKADPALIALLLEKGADPNLVHGGDTPLYLVVKKDCLACVQVLVGAGADVNWAKSDGETALHLARSLGYSEIDAFLVDNGVQAPTPAPVAPRLASADVIRGEKLFASNCQGCHTIGAEGTSRSGPPLWSVLGRERATHPETEYSTALKDWDGIWSLEELNLFLTAPMAVLPGVKMTFPGIPDATDRADLIAYMRLQSEAPVPLP